MPYGPNIRAFHAPSRSEQVTCARTHSVSTCNYNMRLCAGQGCAVHLHADQHADGGCGCAGAGCGCCSDPPGLAVALRQAAAGRAHPPPHAQGAHGQVGIPGWVLYVPHDHTQGNCEHLCAASVSQYSTAVLPCRPTASMLSLAGAGRVRWPRQCMMRWRSICSAAASGLQSWRLVGYEHC